MEELTKALGMKRQLSMAYHPQTERINQEIGMFLWHYVNYQQDDWTNWLAVAEFQYNDKKHVATGKTPFELNFGRHPWCYELKSLESDNRKTLILSNTRELNREFFYKLVYLI